MTKLYIDIDGVLLTKKNTKAAIGAEEFINYAIEHFECYWLTTHCRDRSVDSLLNMMSQYFSPPALSIFKRIRPSVWNTLKTEGIDFSSPFYWLDDYVFEAEKEILRKHNSLDRLILVNLVNGPNLPNVLDIIKNSSFESFKTLT